MDGSLFLLDNMFIYRKVKNSLSFEIKMINYRTLYEIFIYLLENNLLNLLL